MAYTIEDVENLEGDEVLTFTANLTLIGRILEMGFRVYPAESYPRDSRAPLIVGGVQNLLDAELLELCRGRVRELVIVVMRETAHDHEALFDGARTRREQTQHLERQSDHDTAVELLDNSQKVIEIYRECIKWLTKVRGEDPGQRQQQLDPEVVGLIKQFKDTTDYLYLVMQEVARRISNGNNGVAEALVAIGPPDEHQAHVGLNIGFEVLEIVYQLNSYDIERAADLFFAAFFMNCGLWEQDEPNGHESRGAVMYSMLREQIPGLPDVGDLVCEHGKIKAMTHAYVVIVTTHLDEEEKSQRVTYEYSDIPGAEHLIEAQLQETIGLVWRADNHSVAIEVQQADLEFVTDLTALSIAEHVVDGIGQERTYKQILGEMTKEITSPSIPNYSLIRHLHTRQSTYAQILSAETRVHKVFLVGTFIQFAYDENGLANTAEQRMLDGGIGLCYAPNRLWFLGHNNLTGRLLQESEHVQDLVRARMGSNRLPCQRVVDISSALNQRIFTTKRGRVVGILDKRSLDQFLETRRELLIEIEKLIT